MDIVIPSILKIETPDGHGTGFFLGYNQNQAWALIATARHVVEDADKWLKPIRIHNVDKNQTALLQESDRIVFPDLSAGGDTTIIFAQRDKLPLDLPKEPIRFIDSGKSLRIGVEVAWLGYPGIARDTLCFFSGNISARQLVVHRYLIDGVVAPGVSGAPVVYIDSDQPRLVGSISGYMRGDTTVLGLCVAHDVSHLQKTVETFKNRQEAEEAKKEQETTAEAADVSN